MDRKGKVADRRVEATTGRTIEAKERKGRKRQGEGKKRQSEGKKRPRWIEESK